MKGLSQVFISFLTEVEVGPNYDQCLVKKTLKPRPAVSSRGTLGNGRSYIHDRLAGGGESRPSTFVIHETVL
jgi:hypothetical protein